MDLKKAVSNTLIQLFIIKLKGSIPVMNKNDV
jgi:hypothetical protein